MRKQTYRATRGYENLQKLQFWGVGHYGIPQIAPVYDVPDTTWIGFNYVRGCEDPEEHGVHFFLDDYQFQRIWAEPDRYTERLRQFRAVLSPDFSPYANFPLAIQIYNHYRKHWLAAYWQTKGVTVIPTVTWSDRRSFEFCFDGEPIKSVVAISSVSTQTTDEYKQWFLDGYEEMMKRLMPERILWRGTVPSECETDRDRIVEIPTFTARFDAMRKKDGKDTGISGPDADDGER